MSVGRSSVSRRPTIRCLLRFGAFQKISFTSSSAFTTLGGSAIPSPTCARKVTYPWATALKSRSPVSASCWARRAVACSTRARERGSFQLWASALAPGSADSARAAHAAAYRRYILERSPPSRHRTSTRVPLARHELRRLSPPRPRQPSRARMARHAAGYRYARDGVRQAARGPVRLSAGERARGQRDLVALHLPRQRAARRVAPARWRRGRVDPGPWLAWRAHAGKPARRPQREAARLPTRGCAGARCVLERRGRL